MLLSCRSQENWYPWTSQGLLTNYDISRIIYDKEILVQPYSMLFQFGVWPRCWSLTSALDGSTKIGPS